MDFQNDCFYCKTDVTEGLHLKVALTAERAWNVGNGIRATGTHHQIFICTECAKSYLGIDVTVDNNTTVELKLLAQQILPVRRERKWNPTRR